MKPPIRWLLAFFLLATIPLAAEGQGPRKWDGGGADNNWATGANWEADLFPSGFYQEYAQIDNGDTVLVNSDLASLPQDDGYPGALDVENGSALQIAPGGVFNVNTSNGGQGIDGSADFYGGGALVVTGDAAMFTSSSLSFAGGGVFSPKITSVTQSAVSVEGVLTAAGGTLRPSFSGFSPSPQSWILADAASISGDFTLDASGVTLGPGEVLRASIQSGGAGQQLVLTFAQLLKLQVNVDDGSVSIVSPSGTATDLTAYSIASPSGELNVAGWTSLESSLGGGWQVAGTPSATRLEELAGPIPPAHVVQDSLSVGGTPVSLGTAFAVADRPFQATPNETPSFQYVTTSGELVEGLVEFTGLMSVNNLLVTVGADGYVELVNSSNTTLDLQGYTLWSPGGALLPANWTSLESQSVAGADEAASSVSFLSELAPDQMPGVSTSIELSPGESYSLGQIFDASKDQDLELEFAIEGGMQQGDFNGDGVVDAADYTVWRDNLGASTEDSLNGAGDGDNGVDLADYQLWRDHYGESGGSGFEVLGGNVRYHSAGLAPLSEIAAAAVPEPSALWLLASAPLVLLSRKQTARQA